MENKFKEWWAVKYFTGYSFYLNEADAKKDAKKEKTEVIHVIDVKALEAANAEINRLENESDKDGLMLIKLGNEALKMEKNLTDKITSLESENAKLRAALEKLIKTVPYNSIEPDYLKIAREALEK